MSDNIVFYDRERHNDYLSRVYFASLRGVLDDRGRAWTEELESLDAIKDATVHCHGVHLNPETILRLKNNGNRIVAWDINDSSWLSQSYQMAPEVELIDLIFKVSGIQGERVSAAAMKVEEDFGISCGPAEFLPEEPWARYRRMADAGRIQSLPYVLWNNTRHETVPGFGERERKVLIRGGNHYQRFILFLNLLGKGMVAKESWFSTADYFKPEMRADFMYCERCRSERTAFGAVPFDGSGEVGECTSPANWGVRAARANENGSVTYQNGHWDNRCPRSFYWLAQKFEERHGALDHGFLEKAMNGIYAGTDEFYRSLGAVLFYSDLKWMFSIYAPPRFWEAASIRTLNLLPSRTSEQSYFPALVEGEHYLTFKEDFSDLGGHEGVDEGTYRRITDNCLELYEKWMVAGKYQVSDTLLNHIVERIDEIT